MQDLNKSLDFLDAPTIESLVVFRDSALPGIYYHSTKHNFTEFCLTKKGENTEYGNTQQGFFFTNKESLDIMRQDHPGTFGDIVLKVRLNIKNPINLTLEAIFREVNQAATIWEALSQEKVSNPVALKLLDDEIGLGEIGDLRDQLNGDDGLEIIKRNGYDGIISNLGKDHLQYVAFRPDQIQILNKESILKAYNERSNQTLINSIESKRPLQRKFKRRGISI